MPPWGWRRGMPGGAHRPTTATLTVFELPGNNSAILIIFEFTGNYDLILPVMLAAILSSLLARTLHPYSIYTESLRGKGIDLRMEEAVLAGLKARNLMRPDPQILRRGEPYSEVVRKF